MTRTAAMTLQTIWDCRWSRPGYRLTNVEESDQPEAIWMCVRTGTRRPATEEECAACPYWEADEVKAE